MHKDGTNMWTAKVSSKHSEVITQFLYTDTHRRHFERNLVVLGKTCDVFTQIHCLSWNHAWRAIVCRARKSIPMVSLASMISIPTLRSLRQVSWFSAVIHRYVTVLLYHVTYYLKS